MSMVYDSTYNDDKNYVKLLMYQLWLSQMSIDWNYWFELLEIANERSIAWTRRCNLYDVSTPEHKYFGKLKEVCAWKLIK